MSLIDLEPQVCSHLERTGSYPEELKEQVQKALQMLELESQVLTSVKTTSKDK